MNRMEINRKQVRMINLTLFSPLRRAYINKKNDQNEYFKQSFTSSEQLYAEFKCTIISQIDMAYLL